ncbi:hypothetical protein [Hamadaea tsunoensis]|uniref:hypothetical protein n=1 Tax=Hamadaea tsunoensis TaxID=53368 RepID=UPI0004298D1E|nr:hypothetical protein [Hamadaea tsunoensis]
MRIGKYVVALTAVSAFIVSGCGRSSDPAPTESVTGWTVGACVRQTAGPTVIAATMNPVLRQAMEAQRRFAAVPCSDPNAVTRIVAIGAAFDPVTDRGSGDTGCPDDTDVAYRQTDMFPLGAHYACGRNLKDPHPGDPGGGGGPKTIVGDCVVVIGMLDNGLEEVACRPAGWFARVVGLATTAANCPTATISRLPAASGVLCLGSGDGGTIAEVGDCLTAREAVLRPIGHVPCQGTGQRKLVALVPTSAKCPQGTYREPSPGYDRVLCVR